MPNEKLFVQTVEDIHLNAEKVENFLLAKLKPGSNILETSLEEMTGDLLLDVDDIRGALAALMLTDKIMDIVPLGQGRIAICFG